jgi:hypothetical protein
MRSLAATALGIALALSANDTWAFCRSTTCVTAKEDCRVDRDGCVTDGIPLRWSSGCVTFAVHADGSPRWGITFADARKAAGDAFRTWVAARCSSLGDHPSLGAVDLGAVECDQPEYNDRPPLPNANAILFRDEEWPYGDDTTALALTTITFDSDTGDLLDADIEVNSANVALSVGDSNVSTDLQAILTHESGHLLGLAHSSDSAATMNSGYDGTDLGFRILDEDDEAAICEAYQPGADLDHCRGAQPHFGFSRVCGAPYEDSNCQLGAARGAPVTRSPLTLGLVALSVLAWRTRRRRGNPPVQ